MQKQVSIKWFRILVSVVVKEGRQSAECDNDCDIPGILWLSMQCGMEGVGSLTSWVGGEDVKANARDLPCTRQRRPN